MEAAKRGLEISRDKVNEVMHGIGYSNEKSFRSIFKEITGISPIEYRNKFRSDSLAPLKSEYFSSFIDIGICSS